jgi:hypothetical protein
MDCHRRAYLKQYEAGGADKDSTESLTFAKIKAKVLGDMRDLYKGLSEDSQKDLRQAYKAHLSAAHGGTFRNYLSDFIDGLDAFERMALEKVITENSRTITHRYAIMDQAVKRWTSV